MDIAGLAALEDDWLTRHPELRCQPDVWGWEPHPLAVFAALLGQAAAAAAAAEFTDLGCGIGTKCLLATARGLAAGGVERVPAYAAEARRLGVPVIEADLRSWDGYGRLRGVVYINHPLRGEDAEDALEARIQAALEPGTVLITVSNPRTRPAAWPLIATAGEGTDWAAVKP